jgi:ribosome-associated protein
MASVKARQFADLLIHRQCSTLAQGELIQTLTNRAAGVQRPEELEQSPNWLVAARAAESKKAADIRILDLREVTSFTDYFIICSAANARQGHAISNEIAKQLKEMGELPVSLEGFDSADWVLMDYGDFLVHIFSESARAYYDLERLWRHGKLVDMNGSVVPAP